MSVSESEWVSRFATELGIDPPSSDEVQELLMLAGVAAHASERTAAPIACWLAARAGVNPAEARSLAEQVSNGLDSGGDSGISA